MASFSGWAGFVWAIAGVGVGEGRGEASLVNGGWESPSQLGQNDGGLPRIKVSCREGSTTSVLETAGLCTFGAS